MSRMYPTVTVFNFRLNDRYRLYVMACSSANKGGNGYRLGSVVVMEMQVVLVSSDVFFFCGYIIFFVTTV